MEKREREGENEDSSKELRGREENKSRPEIDKEGNRRGEKKEG